MKTIKGIATNTSEVIIGKVVIGWSLNRSGKVLVSQKGTSLPFGYRSVISTVAGRAAGNTPRLQISESDRSSLHDGDCISISPNGTLSVLWDTTVETNSLFLTETCDCSCVMCPQSPQGKDEENFLISEELVELLSPSQVKTICITGGEPTLFSIRFLDLMKKIQKKFSKAHVLLLTNGKTFANFEFAREFAGIGFRDLTVCVSLHSDLEETNDLIAGVPGSFYKTVQGLYNLARFRQRVEIRHVVSRLNANRLEQFAHFVYRNFPFAYHIALMGMEMSGMASDNRDQVWTDPYDYRGSLAQAVKFLHRTALHVSIYNIPLCLLFEESRPFARQSISEWKNVFNSRCHDCRVKEVCCGFFETSGQMVSSHVSPILT